MKKEVNQKGVIAIFISFMLLGIIFAFCIFNEYNSIKKIDVKEFTNKNMRFDIDSIDNRAEEKIVTINGWAAKENEDLRTVKTYVALRNTDTLEVLKINTGMENRKDITSKYNGVHKYDNSGFHSRFNKNAIKDKGNYEICILYLSDNHNDFVPTGKVIKIE